jgi:hypothetical protein
VSTRRVEKEIALSKVKVGLQNEQTHSPRSQAAITLIADWGFGIAARALTPAGSYYKCLPCHPVFLFDDECIFSKRHVSTIYEVRPSLRFGTRVRVLPSR